MTHRPDSVFPPAPPGENPRTAADLFVDCLENEGVEFVFGIPGEETLDLSEALDRSQLITFVPTRHEQGAAFMADAWGRLTGRPGVCLATLGPGRQQPRHRHRRRDARPRAAGRASPARRASPACTRRPRTSSSTPSTCCEPMTKWNTRIHHQRMVPEAVRKAFSIASAEKPGATHLELPEDIMGAPADGRAAAHRVPSP